MKRTITQPMAQKLVQRGFLSPEEYKELCRWHGWSEG